jgi:N-acetylmuramoyl-L-alanine amidase
VSCLLGALLAAVLAVGPSLGCGGFETGAARPPQPPISVVEKRAARSPQPPISVVEKVQQPSRNPEAPSAAAVTRSGQSLAGRTIVLDAGHQLGNHNFPAEINRPVPAGGFDKPCNTTGTATNGGYPEATFAWNVTTRLEAKLERSGATVLLTRTSNSEDAWGPCVDVRGRAGNAKHADLKLSIHGDGSLSAGAHGFHVIYPADRAPWTDDIYRPSKRLALVTRAALLKKGFTVADYIAGGDGLDERSDLGTLNLSDVPTVMLESGNMRDSGDAAVMTSRQGQARYARALAVAVRTYLG